MIKSSRFLVIGVAIVACMLAAGTALTDNNDQREQGIRSAVAVPATHGTGEGSRGNLQYDDGVPAYRDGAIGPGFVFIGNQFSAGLPTGAHTLTAATINLAGLWPSNATLGFFGPLAGTTAPFMGFQAFTGLTAIGWASAALSPVPAGSGSFLVGVWNSNYALCSGDTALGGTCDGVALGAGTNGMGHNAMRISMPTTTAASASGFAPIPGQNALLRVSGSNVPVELMRFEVE